MKKIAILFPYLRGGGICKVPAIQSIMFYEAGYEVDLIVRDDLADYKYAGNIINLGVKKRSGLLKFLSYIEFYFKVRKAKMVNYDFVISHTPHCDIINVLTRKKEKVITTVHSNIEKKYSKLAFFLLKLVVSKSDAVVAVSNEAKLKVEKHVSKKNIYSIYNPLDLDDILYQAQQPLPDYFSGDYILSVGRIAEEKGNWHIIKSFSLICEKFPNMKLVFVGAGPLLPELEKLSINLGIRDRVIFEGNQVNPYKYMAGCKFLVQCSLHEGFGLVLAEAMACNTFVISTDCQSGPREIISPDKLHQTIDYQDFQKYGYLVPDFASIKGLYDSDLYPQDEFIASAFLRILESESSVITCTINASDRALAFSKVNILKCWEDLFELICQH